ncbi:MAG: hypothetical protein M3Q14_03085 [bacterium]|nr:hypothetical protein [bacterium]
MINPESQTRLIRQVYEAGGFVQEEFWSAAGIRSNFKIQLQEAANHQPDLHSIFGHLIAREIGDVDVLAATGGAIKFARAAAEIAMKPLILVEAYYIKGAKYFRLNNGGLDLAQQEPEIGFIEDVTSTKGTIKRVIETTGLEQLITQGVACWRRGRVAPTDMGNEDIQEYNRRFAFRELYEEPLPFPMSNIIERFVPLWIPTEQQQVLYIPEMEEV